MKLAVYAPFSRLATSTGLAAGLEAAGARVTRIQVPQGGIRRRLTRAKRSFLELATRDVDTLLLMKGAWLDLEDLRWLTSVCDVTYVTFDTLTCGPPGRVRSLGARAQLCKRAVATGAEAVRWLRAKRVPTAQIFQGCRPEIWAPKPADHDHGITRRIFFPGHVYDGDGGRAGYLAALTAAGLPLEHANPAIGTGLFLEACAARFTRSAVTLNLVPQRSPGSFSNRVVRAAMAGGCILSEWCEDLATLPTGVVRTFTAPHEMLDAARTLLDRRDANAWHRERALAWAAGMSWAHQAEKYIRFIRGEEVPNDGAA